VARDCQRIGKRNRARLGRLARLLFKFITGPFITSAGISRARATRSGEISCIAAISPLAVVYRSRLVINERRAREKSKAIKPRRALLTNYSPTIVIASLCQSPRASLARSICIPVFAPRKPVVFIFNPFPAELGS